MGCCQETFSEEDTFGDSEEESDQVVSDSEMAEEIAKMYEIDESPLHVKEKEVEPVFIFSKLIFFRNSG